ISRWLVPIEPVNSPPSVGEVCHRLDDPYAWCAAELDLDLKTCRTLDITPEHRTSGGTILAGKLKFVPSRKDNPVIRQVGVDVRAQVTVACLAHSIDFQSPAEGFREDVLDGAFSLTETDDAAHGLTTVPCTFADPVDPTAWGTADDAGCSERARRMPGPPKGHATPSDGVCTAARLRRARPFFPARGESGIHSA